MKTNPWLSEKNYYQWTRNGLLCEIRRAKDMGHLNGYVGLPKTHPLINLNHEELYQLLPNLYVHGGLTFSTVFPHNELFPRLNKRKPWLVNGMAWTYGFDCAHLGDYVPGMDKTLTKVMKTENHSMHPSKNTYRDVVYVRQQVNNLADQIHKYAKENNATPT